MKSYSPITLDSESQTWYIISNKTYISYIMALSESLGLKDSADIRMGAGTLIVWIRREMRAQDHLALWSAAGDASSVLPLYIIDRAFLSSSPARQLVALRSLRLLREELKKLGGNLFVRRGEAHEVLIGLARQTGSAGVYVTRSYEPGIVKADARLRAALESEGRIFRDFKDDVIFEKSEILNSSGEPFRVYTAYRRAWLAKRDEIAPPLPALRDIDSPAIDPGEIPAAHELGLKSNAATPEGGEAAGLVTLNSFLANRAGAYLRNRDLLAEDGTSRLSHHLALGTLSPRKVYRAISERMAGGADPGVEEKEGLGTFLNQVVWREFYKQILANFPHVEDKSFKKDFDAVPWKTNVGLFNAWRDGVTGYPIVDAGMRQLKAEGWMHNRGRMIVAGFLTKDLHVDWRMGERHFLDLLVDGDLALNNGGWQWSAGTGTDAQPWYRIFNPVLQGRKFDPDGRYVKKYLPGLSEVPDRYLHSPWEMPESIAREAGIRIGRDYPAPVVDHAEERRQALTRYRPGRQMRLQVPGTIMAAVVG
jgi:deoxyribodipyrimidine photo-lyase